MQEEVISRLISYYLENEKFSTEIERAKNIFFGTPDDTAVLMIEDKYESFFLEWLVFDFKLSNNKTLIADYYDRNPRKLQLYERQIYKNLENNVYGLLEVKKIQTDEGLEALMLHTGKKYYLKERSATHYLNQGNLFFGRVADVGGHWELVGSDSFTLDIKLDSKARKFFLGSGQKITPRDAIVFLNKKEEKDDSETKSIEDIKNEFDIFLEEIGLIKMLNSDLMQKWLAEISFKNTPSPLSSILFNLLEDALPEQKMDKLLSLSADLMNYSPQKELKGKSPIEISRTVEPGSKGYNYFVSQMGGEWSDKANKAMGYMKDDDVLSAVDQFEKTFRMLFREKTASRHVHKLFANYAVCNLSIGNEYIARQLLEIALLLNKNYKFASRVLKKIDSGENIDQQVIPIRYALKNARKKHLKEFWNKVKNYNDRELCSAYYDFFIDDAILEWQKNPAKKYYDFLKKLEINFDAVE